MSKNYSQKRRLKYVLLALACTTTFSLTGIAAACKKPEDNNEDEKKTSREDVQLLKNGNFEFFDVPEQKKDENAPVYLINTPNNWTHGGTSSYTMSGIIGTSETAWKAITDEGLADALDYNNGLDSSASNYKSEHVDYNGMKSSDLLYKDTYAALNYKEEDGKEGETDPRKVFISNPGTHYNAQIKDGKLYYNDGTEEKQGYIDEKGDYFFDADFKEPFSHVLMLHNYATEHNGIAQNYASVSVDLPANTAAEISVWVKTSDLFFSQGKKVEQDRGANIAVKQTVGSTSIDDFKITCINTEKLLGNEQGSYSGWVQYKMYVKACDFASSTVSITLGLGESNYNVEGYAFFDDLKVTKYKNINDCESYKAVEGNNNVLRTCDLTSDESEKIYKADSYSRNNGNITDERDSKYFNYLIDLASQANRDDVTFGNGGKHVTAGLTVDTDGYASALTSGAKLKNIDSLKPANNAKLPKEFSALNTEHDLIGFWKAGDEININGFDYNSRLNTALAFAKHLPNVNTNADNNMLVMLSAYGAAYTSSFDLAIGGGDHQIISFWVKTSDMNGTTAATVKITEKANKDNTANITLDTSDKSTDIGTTEDEKDIFEGWVQCFLFVSNEMKETADFTVEFSFGNTTIKDTTANSYKGGWVALANMQTLEVSEEIFGYTSNGDYSASLTIKDSEEKKTNVFDEAYGSQAHEIENGPVNPANYSGVNGSSSSVVKNDHVSIPFDDINQYDVNGVKYAGLINRDHVDNYAEQNWYNAILNSFNVNINSLTPDTDISKALASWHEVFGSKCVQPLIIVNKLRDSYVEEKGITKETFAIDKYFTKDNEKGFVPATEFDEKETYYSLKQVMNYGFIGESKSVAADSYSTVSVKVKVSAGAVAYVYLTDTSAGKEVLSLSTPSYSFWYDEDGNVLKAKLDDGATIAQQRENVLYTLRNDGLYEDKEGKLFANTWTLIKTFKNESAAYFNEAGARVSFDNLVKGETYYVDAEKTKEVDHFLENSAGVKIFEFKDGEYYYIVDGKTQSNVVKPFDTQYARYDSVEEEYKFVLDARYDMSGKFMGTEGAGELGYDKDGNKVADKWVTVNFVIHAGSEAKSYRLELWSGARETTGVNDGTGSKEDSAVLFDYSYTSISDETLKTEYEKEIVRAYRELLIKNGVTGFASSSENISYYQKLVKENNISQSAIDEYEILKNFTAHYYTFSLYDSQSFLPFNKDVNTNSTGYDYSLNDYTESLAYLEVKDGDVYTIFTDYSTIDKSISLNTDEDNDDNTDDSEEETTDSSVWLLMSSIILVVVLLFAMLAIFVKDMLKKRRRNKVTSKNNYNHNKTSRYMRKLHIKKDQFEEQAESDEATQPVESEDEEPVEESEVTEEGDGNENE